MSEDRPITLQPKWAALASAEGTPTSAFRLPPDMLEAARRRLNQFMVLAVVSFSFAAALMAVQSALGGGTSVSATVNLVNTTLGLTVSVGVLALGLWKRVSHEVVLWAGLVFEVVVCFTFSMTDNWEHLTEHGTPGYLTFVVCTIVMFPLFVPSPPVRALLASIIAASTAPLSLAILSRMGVFEPAAVDYLNVSIGPVIAVVIAMFSAYVVNRLNMAVARARHEAEVARHMGSYRLERLLGRGGMGEVWRADHRLLARPAAVKLVRPEALQSADPQVVRSMLGRFEREAQATASLSSPHTVQLYDFGSAEDGTCYYVMELLEGLDLDHLIRRYGPIAPERAVHILLQVCDSLGDAHDAGLVHRDVKPANIFLCRRGRRDDYVKVLDFGLVALRSGPSEDEARLTAQGLTVGTPAFMAPELAVSPDEVDARADLYALGCVGYYLLTGRPVFEAATPMAVVLAHAQESPVPPSRLSESAVPTDLEELLLSCLEKRPRDRPANAEEVAQRLEQTALAARWTPDRARRWWDTHRPHEERVE